MAKGFKRFQDHQNEGAGEINISPLIDVVFILLIFFIVTTVFVDETGVEVEKPRAASQKELDQNSILIGITAEGGVYHSGREIGVGGIHSRNSAQQTHHWSRSDQNECKWNSSFERRKHLSFNLI